jgi:hypothetical protein
MFNREIILGDRRLVILLMTDPVSGHNDNYFFGFPLSVASTDIDNTSISKWVESAGGYFLYVGIDSDRVVIANDITGGYRLYIYQVDKTAYLSDHIESIVDSMRRHETAELDENGFYYWRKHGYTTGGATFIKNLHKLEPATILEFKSNGLSRNCYFPDVENRPDAQEHTRQCLDNLDQTVKAIKTFRKDIILFFSGGVDSTLLALYLKALRINLRLVFARSLPYYRDNYQNHMRAIAVSRYLGLPFDEIEIDWNRAIDKADVISRLMPFDRHPALLHFGAMKEISRRYGKDIIIVNGQGADSVLSFGPSGMTRGDLAARALMYRPFGALARIAGHMVRRTFGRQFLLPANRPEFMTAFIDQFQYYTVISDNESQSYRSYLTSLVETLNSRWKYRESLMMYLKIYTYLQGSDNQVVIQSARAAGISKVIMPYVTPGFILDTVRYKDSRRDLYRPKYVIGNGLKVFGFDPPRLRPETTQKKLIPLEQLVEQVEKRFLTTAGTIVEGIEKVVEGGRLDCYDRSSKADKGN